MDSSGVGPRFGSTSSGRVSSPKWAPSVRRSYQADRVGARRKPTACGQSRHVSYIYQRGTHMLEKFDTDIWTAAGPQATVAGFHYPTRMVVMRLSGDRLFIWSPVALTTELRRS